MHLLGSGGSCAMLPLRMLGILMLMILCCDSEDSCLDNPVFLDPPEIIEEYGRYVSLNCSSTLLEYNKILLTVKKQKIPEEPGRNYAVSQFLLDDWNIDARCSLRLNDTHKCYKDAAITVYKNPEVDLFVKRKDGEGEKLQLKLQCDIFNVAPVQNLSVRWYKNDHLIKTKSFPETIKAAVNVSSQLAVNMSREENAALFRCEAQLNLNLNLPAAVSQTIKISANEFPTSRDVTTIQESFNLTSEAEATPPPEFVVANTTSYPLNMPEPDNFTGINSSITEDNESVTLNNIPRVGNTTKAHRPEANACDTLKKGLRITPPEMVVRYGDSMVRNCSVDDISVILVSWETEHSHKEISNYISTLTINKVEQWNLNPICFAVTSHGDQCIWEQVITVYKTPDSVLVTAVDPGPMIEGKEYQLSCNIQRVAPVNKLLVKWYRGDECLHTEPPENSSLMTPQNRTYFWPLRLERGDNGSTFRCEAELQLGSELSPLTTSTPYTAHVHYKPFFKSCPDRHTVVENAFRISQLQCETDGNPAPSVIWYHLNQKLTDLNKLLTRTDSGLYRANVSNSIGKNSTNVYITVEYPPSFNCNRRYEAKMNGELKTPCEPEGSPPPTITWLKNGAEVFSTRHLTKEYSGNYTLKATNKHGTAQHMLYLEILYPPEFNQANTSAEIIPGQNMTLNCSAEGNPEPETHWNYTSAENLRVATVGRHKIMTITRATSTNAGHYICVASNKLGRVTRSVILTEMGKTGDGSLSGSFLWIIICIILIFILLSVVVLFFYKKRKRGIYSFVENRDPSQIPLTNRSAAANP